MNPSEDPSNNRSDSENPAADLIRHKLNQLYTDEPSARDELQEVQTPGQHSKHQHFMLQLSQSGRSLAEIQTAWHNYYVALPDDEKHRVWQEFYQEHQRRTSKSNAPKVLYIPPSQHSTSEHRSAPNDTRTVADIKNQLLNHVRTRANPKKGGHLKSLLFGLTSGVVVVSILMFGFFNERFLAPFITPSKSVSSTPIIIDPNSTVVGSEPKIIIPKINVEIPVVYDEPSIDEHAVQTALERGVLHYATTSNPGELGNGTIFGHSSNNILNKGNYKFAFVLLKRLEAGDTFILQKDGKRYVYRVFSKKVVKPEDVSVLSDAQGKPATFTLITCDPPGTSLNRLVVAGEQITPDPVSNVASSAKANATPKVLPSNSPTLWSRITGWFTD